MGVKPFHRLAATLLVSRVSVFEELNEGYKNSLNPSQDLRTKTVNPIVSVVLRSEAPDNIFSYNMIDISPTDIK